MYDGGHKENAFIQSWLDAVDQRADASPPDIALAAFIDSIDTSRVWNYAGSFTTPPCTEGVNWNVVGEVQSISAAQLQYFIDAAGEFGNNRVLLPLNDRTLNASFDPRFKAIPDIDDLFDFSFIEDFFKDGGDGDIDALIDSIPDVDFDNLFGEAMDALFDFGTIDDIIGYDWDAWKDKAEETEDPENLELVSHWRSRAANCSREGDRLQRALDSCNRRLELEEGRSERKAGRVTRLVDRYSDIEVSKADVGAAGMAYFMSNDINEAYYPTEEFVYKGTISEDCEAALD